MACAGLRRNWHGLKLANWYAETVRNIERFERTAEEMRVGKLSGAVGTFAHLEPEFEEKICARLGLEAAPISTQVIQRDRHAYYVATLATIASTLDKIATEIRHLQRTEVREAEEFFSEKQKGSSAMPHKRNPITCEQISGLARVVRANAQVAFENVALWHERDISHSSAERVILPDSRMLRCGTSAIFHIPQPNASSSPTRPRLPTICSTRQPR